MRIKWEKTCPVLRTGRGTINAKLNKWCFSDFAHSLLLPLRPCITLPVTHLTTCFWMPGTHWSNSRERLKSVYVSQQLWMRISLRSHPRGSWTMSLKTQAGPENCAPAPGRQPRELKFRVEEFKPRAVHECSWTPKSNPRNCLYQQGMT